MLIDKLRLPKIIDDLAKFDGRKKRYVPYPSILKDSDMAGHVRYSYSPIYRPNGIH